MSNLIAKSDRDFLEMIFKGYINGDQNAVEMTKVALQAFMQKPKKIQRKIEAFKKIQAVSVSTDIDITTADAFNLTLEQANFDLGYEKVFRVVPLGEGQDFWEIYNCTNALIFKKVPEGDRVEVADFKAQLDVQPHVDYYGGAIGWTDKMIRFRKLAAMIDVATIFRNSFYVTKADAHYLLLAVACALNVTAYQAGTGQLQRDIATINQAAFDLTDRCKDKGFGDTAAMPLVMYANPLYKARIEAAFRVSSDSLAAAGAAGQTILNTIERVYTFNANIGARPKLIIPGNKIQRADAMAPTTFKAPQDILTLNFVQSVWAIYGAAVGDTDQCQEMILS